MGTEPLEGTRHRQGARVVAAVVASALIVGATAAAVLALRDDGSGPVAPAGRSTTTSTTTATTTTTEGDRDRGATTTATTAVPNELEAAVEDLSGFVEERRGRRFLRPVDVELLDGAAFVDRLDALAEDDREELEEGERVLRALRLVDPGADLAAALERFRGEAVLGFYDDEAGSLVVRGATLGPYARLTLVHELTHAFDDQHFDLSRPALDDADDESSIGFSALVEGNAVRVQEAYRASLSDDERAAAAAEEEAFGDGIDLSGVPDAVVQILTFPYSAGPPFVAALLGAGGEGRVDEAFGAPPTTSEQVLAPQAFLGGEPVAEVALPRADGEVFDSGTYGLYALLLTLVEDVGVEAARRAAIGWAGDAYVAWDEGARTCVRAVFVMDSEGDVGELAGAWRTWADANGDAEVAEEGAGVTVTSCA